MIVTEDYVKVSVRKPMFVACAGALKGLKKRPKTICALEDDLLYVKNEWKQPKY